VVWSILYNWKYRAFIKVRWGNYWRHTWPATDGIYVFLLNPYMKKLDTKIAHDLKGKVRMVSFAFELPDRRPIRVKNGLFLYVYN
jgi:hypothetical protein